MNESPFVQARWQRAGRRATLDLIVMHSTEGSERPDSAEATAEFFRTIERQASAHAAVDQDSVVFCVLKANTAFHAAGANDRGYGIEQCGKAGQDAAGWNDPASAATIVNAARLCAAVIREHPNIRPVWLTASDLTAGRFGGITSHAEVEKWHPSSGHWDPGPNYPHATLIAAVKAELGQQTEDDMTPEEHTMLTDLGRNLKNLDTVVKAADSNNAQRYNDLKAQVEALAAKVGQGGGASPGAVADELAKRLGS